MNINYLVFTSGLLFSIFTAQANEVPKNIVLTDPEVAKQVDPDFLIQGEYGSAVEETVGVQVIALGNGEFHAVICEDGLPGVGASLGKKRVILTANRVNGKIDFKAENAPFFGSIESGKFLLVSKEGKKFTLPKIHRESPTLHAKPPTGALVLFDGTNVKEWNEKAKIVDNYLQATGATTKQSFGDYELHLEFRTPYMPFAKGQARGNSGIFHSGRWETQILDSFGLDGNDNETGGIYSIAKPRLNMCFPPLSWQTYDVNFKAAQFDANGKLTAWPRITVKVNGILVHEDFEIQTPSTVSSNGLETLKSPLGPISLQNHGNPVVFRNIWILPKR